MEGNHLKWIFIGLERQEKRNLFCGIDIFPLLWPLSLYESAGRTGFFEYHKTGDFRSVYGRVFISALFADKPLGISDSGTWIVQFFELLHE